MGEDEVAASVDEAGAEVPVAPGADTVSTVENGDPATVPVTVVVRTGIDVIVEKRAVVLLVVVAVNEPRMLDASSGEMVVVSGVSVMVVPAPSEMGTGMNWVIVCVADGASESPIAVVVTGRADGVNVVEKRSRVDVTTFGGIVLRTSVDEGGGRALVGPLSADVLLLLSFDPPMSLGGGSAELESPLPKGSSNPAAWNVARASDWFAQVTTLQTTFRTIQ